MKSSLLIPPASPCLPDKNGFFGEYEGQYIPEVLRPNLDQLEREFYNVLEDETFWHHFVTLMQEFSGRPTPITYAQNLSQKMGVQLFLKREDLNQTGARKKINNAIGQGLLMQRLGKKKSNCQNRSGSAWGCNGHYGSKVRFSGLYLHGK